MTERVVGDLVALALLQLDCAAVGQLGRQRALEHQQDVALLAPVIGEVAGRVLDDPHADVVEGPGPPERLARLARMFGALDGFPVGRPEGYLKHKHGSL